MATALNITAITPEQLAAMPNDKDFELVDGRLVERKTGNKSSWIAAQLAMLLAEFVDEHHLGWVFSSAVGYCLHPDRPNNVRKPDVSFVRFGRLPKEEPADGYDYLAPDLAVEVTSPGDTVYDLETKVDEYLIAGVRTVWVINSELKTIKVFSADGPILQLGKDNVLYGGGVLPGFSCRVSDLFIKPV